MAGQSTAGSTWPANPLPNLGKLAHASPFRWEESQAYGTSVTRRDGAQAATARDDARSRADERREVANLGPSHDHPRYSVIAGGTEEKRERET